MRIVVTGREGQVVRSLVERAVAAGVEIVPLGRPEFDLTQPETIAPAIVSSKPDIVVSAAAYTAVDHAEDEPTLAFAVNRDGAGQVAAAAATVGVPVIHLSTDYVFDGLADRPYVETDTPNPQSVYGASKLAGEQAVVAANPWHLILRTAWVYSPFGKNFVKTMLRLAETRDEVSVVADQWGNPTSALNIADGILHVCRALAVRSDVPCGVYHIAGGGSTNWAGFAREIFAASRHAGGPYASVRDITTADYPMKAKRPGNSRLDTAKISSTFGWIFPAWQGATQDAVSRVIGESRAGGVHSTA